MGMSDKQFNAYNRQLLDRIQEVIEITTDEIVKSKLEKIAESLQKSIED